MTEQEEELFLSDNNRTRRNEFWWCRSDGDGPRQQQRRRRRLMTTTSIPSCLLIILLLIVVVLAIVVIMISWSEQQQQQQQQQWQSVSSRFSNSNGGEGSKEESDHDGLIDYYNNNGTMMGESNNHSTNILHGSSSSNNNNSSTSSWIPQENKDNNVSINDDLSSFSWSCEVSTQKEDIAKPPSSSPNDNEDNDDDDDSRTRPELKRHRQKLLLVFATPRCGSTLLQVMLNKINAATNDSDAVVVGLNEIFNEGNRNPGFGIHSFMEQVCSPNIVMHHSEISMNDTDTWFNGSSSSSSGSENDLRQYNNNTSLLFSNRSNVMETMNSSSSSWEKELETCIDERYTKPRKLLNFMRGVPSVSNNGFWSFKIMPYIKSLLNMSVESFMELILEVWDRPNEVVVIVQWRRRFIESFVSQRIAASTGSWYGKGTSENNSITVSKRDLVHYAKSWKEYYRSVRKTLEHHNITYDVVEYHRDLLTETVQLATMERMLRLLGIPLDRLHSGWNDTKEFEAGLLTKQNKVPVEKLVKNWRLVKKLGFDSEVPDWNDGF